MTSHRHCIPPEISLVSPAKCWRGLSWGNLAYIHLLYEMKNVLRTAPDSAIGIAAMWRVLEIWAYEHFPGLAPACPGVAAYPFAASWEGAERSMMTTTSFRRALRVMSFEEVCWRPFSSVHTPASAMRAYFISGGRVLISGIYPPHVVPGCAGDSSAQHCGPARSFGSSRIHDVEGCRDRGASYRDFLSRLALAVRFMPQVEEVDPEDVPYVDREHRRGRREDRTPQTGVLMEQTGRNLGRGPDSSVETHCWRSDVDPRDVPSSSTHPGRYSYSIGDTG
ncbi:hypothetical protein SOVF_205610, partial [Spinacia oleracea]